MNHSPTANGLARPKDEAQGLSNVHKKKNFPYKIALAISAISAGSAFPELKPSARSVLSFIVRLAKSGDPTSPTWAYKDTIASALGISRPTVNRALKVLNDSGLIERLDQEKKRYNGRFFYARISLTEKACRVLGLLSFASCASIHQERFAKPFTPVARGSKQSEVVDSSTLPQLNLSHGSVNLPTEVHRSQSLQKHSSEASGQSVKPVAHEPFYQVPSELLWLIEMRLLTPPQMFLLMREYGEQKKRLSDAIAHVSDRIKSLPKGDVFRYLRKLSKAPTDFAAAVKIRIERVTEAAVAKQIKRAVQQAPIDMAGRYLTNENTSALYLVDREGYAQSWRWEQGKVLSGSQPINAHFVNAIQAEQLVEISKERATEIHDQWHARANHSSDVAQRHEPVDLSALKNLLKNRNRGLPTESFSKPFPATDHASSCCVYEVRSSFNQSQCNIESGYWKHSPTGIPVPGFLVELLREEHTAERFGDRFIQFGRRMPFVPFALELEHRQASIVTSASLNKALDRISDPHYDFTHAVAFSEQFQAIEKTKSMVQLRPAEGRLPHSQEDKLLREIEQKSLPRGMKENLALMLNLLAPHRNQLGVPA